MSIRSWTNYEGRQIEAVLLNIDGKYAEMRGKDGREFRYKITDLSPDDQLYIANKIRQQVVTQPVAPTKPVQKVKIKLDKNDDFKFEYSTGYLDGKMTVLYSTPEEINDDTAVIMTLHHYSGDGKDMFRVWNRVLDKSNYVLICPIFADLKLDRDSYNTAGLSPRSLRKDDDFFEKVIQPQKIHGQTNIFPYLPRMDRVFDDIFVAVNAALDLKKKTYYLYGDQTSAGAVQYLISFYKGNQIGAVAVANGDGFIHPESIGCHVGQYYSEYNSYESVSQLPVRLLVGEKLEKKDKYTWSLPNSDVVGKTVMERNLYLLNTMHKIARDNHLKCRWELATVEGEARNWCAMAREALGFFNTTRID